MAAVIPTVLISGPVGVGKSAAGAAVSTLLSEINVPHAYVDFDDLRPTDSGRPDDPWGNRGGLENLAAHWKSSIKAGARNLVLAYVVEDWSFVDGVRNSVPGSSIQTVQLTANRESIVARLKQRDAGARLSWCLNRSVELEQSLNEPDTPCDLRMDTSNRSVADVARVIVNRVNWQPG